MGFAIVARDAQRADPRRPRRRPPPPERSSGGRRAVAQRVPARPDGRHRPCADDPRAGGPRAQPRSLRRVVERRRHPTGPRRAGVVVDASVLTDFLLGRTQSIEALEDALAGADQEPLHAPDLIELETLNALRRLAATGRLGERRAAEAASDLGDARLIRYPHAPLRTRVWELRHNLTAYDAAYLALAEALPDPTLLTAHHGLATAARHSLGRSRVQMLA